jgi:hypothetical protein
LYLYSETVGGEEGMDADILIFVLEEILEEE